MYKRQVLEASCDLAMNLFAPLCAGEILRVLKPGGVFLLGVPDRRHLWQLKQAVYREPYENELKEPELPGFSLLEDYPVKDWLLPVSYTHLDVYKRQFPMWTWCSPSVSWPG